MYHSSQVARDRDRLRDQVLRGLDWRLHRIWGTAWYRDRHGQEQRLRRAIQAAVSAPVRGLLGGQAPDGIDRPAITSKPASLPEVPEWGAALRHRRSRPTAVLDRPILAEQPLRHVPGHRADRRRGGPSPS
jgi:hypothetical protein